MQHDQFIGQVQHRAHLASRGEAERATRATLEALGERLSPGGAENLGAQLPHEIGQHLTRAASTGAPARPFSSREFLDLVREKEGGGVDEPAAAFHARCVMEVLDEATTGGVLTKVRDQLPHDFDRLFEAGSTGRMPPSAG